MFLFDVFIFATPWTPGQGVRDARPPYLCHCLLPHNPKFLTPYTSSHSVAYRGGVGVFNLPPEIPKALQNRAKPNPILKTVKNC